MGSARRLVLLDLSVAFDTVDHGILLEGPKEVGVEGTILELFCSYQKVILGNYYLAPWLLRFHESPCGDLCATTIMLCFAHVCKNSNS